MAESTITRMWYRKGGRPKVRSYAGRKSVSYSGYVNPTTGKLFVARPDWFNYSTTIECLRAFIARQDMTEGKHLFLVMDNAPWHRKAKRLIESEQEYEDIRNALTIISLPPYSPDLNPIEQVWRITRREKTHNRFWARIESLRDCLDNWFRQFEAPNAKLASLCSFS